MSVDIEVPGTITAATEKVTGTGDQATAVPVTTHAKHLYVAPQGHPKVEAGRFPAALTSWEADVLARELDHPTLDSWYRNPARSKHGLGIPYVAGSGIGLTYPDFAFFHEVEGRVVVDIVDPHNHSQSDTGPKWAGLARWAAGNRGAVRRVVAVIKTGHDLRALDLTQDDIAARLDDCSTLNDIETLFEDRGGAY
ncbi:MAG: hypothetical protein ACSLE6_12230 [Mycobacterium sp.]